MKIGFIIRKNHSIWGGDLGVVGSLMRGLKSLGHETKSASSPFALEDMDMVFLTNSSVEQRSVLEELSMLGMPFGVLGFHEDILLYYTAATGMFTFIQQCLDYGLPTDNGMKYSIEQLFTHPQTVYYYGETPKKTVFYNHEMIVKASLWIANSEKEKKTILRDHPGSRVSVIPVAPGVVTRFSCKEPSCEFLTFSGLSSKSYFLQVGRLEIRKNQLGTILATKDLDAPLVFIATRAFDPRYEVACFEAARRYRKAPTLFISANLKERKEGSTQVIAMSGKLSTSMLWSAYYHAGLHIHPAFHELPGATYLEAAFLGTPTIASTWCTIDEYFFNEQTGDSGLDGRILYRQPHHLEEITQAIPALFGQTYPLLLNHPALTRGDEDAAKDLLGLLREP